MHFKFRNVNDAFTTLVKGIHTGEIPTTRRGSRVGEVLQIEEPVIVTYEKPRERVLFNPARDANPFFHLFESLWMLAGRNDLTPLQYYVSTFNNYSDDGETLNGAYGYRWRHALVDEYVNHWGGYVDQLKIITEHLRTNPNSRRAVLQMWNVEDDLLKMDTSKDVCCNLSVMFSIRHETNDHHPACGCPECAAISGGYTASLDMTVTNRSNDLVWGMLGANVVHFSMLQEYMAACIGVGVGVYNQVSNNLHVYTDPKKWKPEQWLRYVDETQLTMHDPEPTQYGNQVKSVAPLVETPEVFDRECDHVVYLNSNGDCVSADATWTEPFFNLVAQPMFHAWHLHKQRDYPAAEYWIDRVEAEDWRIAGTQWLNKREALYLKRQENV